MTNNTANQIDSRNTSNRAIHHRNFALILSVACKQTHALIEAISGAKTTRLQPDPGDFATMNPKFMNQAVSD